MYFGVSDLSPFLRPNFRSTKGMSCAPTTPILKIKGNGDAMAALAGRDDAARELRSGRELWRR
jgi:hypothetical protein